jgi:hypothetical protein
MKEIFLHLLTDLKISPMVSHPEILPCAGWKSPPPVPVRMTDNHPSTCHPEGAAATEGSLVVRYEVFHTI